jgi:hypothetical protein
LFSYDENIDIRKKLFVIPNGVRLKNKAVKILNQEMEASVIKLCERPNGAIPY